MDDEERLAEHVPQQGPIGPRTEGRWVVGRRLVGGRLYQLEMVRCGKRRERKDGTIWECRCLKPDGELHGPYWYEYRCQGKRGGGVEAGGRWRRKYVGVTLDVD